MSQSIDFSAVTDATFNGATVDEIKLNGTSIWEKLSFPTGQAQVMGIPPWYTPEDKWPNKFSNMSPGDGVHSGLALSNGENSSVLYSYQAVLSADNTIEIWVDIGNSNHSYITNGNGDSVVATTGPSVLTHSELQGLTNNTSRHGQGRIYNSNPDNGFPVGDPHTVGDGTIAFSIFSRMFEGSTSSHWVKVGHYDATQTFIVGPEFSSPQTFTIDTIIYGLYGPSTLTNTSVITKISSNIFKVTWSGDVGTETTYTGAVNGTMATYTFSVGWNSPIYTGSCSNGEFRMSGGDYAGSGTVYNYLTLKLP